MLGVSCTLQVIGRQFNLFPIYWQEVRPDSFIMVTLGSVVVVSEDGHLKINVILDMFPEKQRRHIKILVHIITILFLIAWHISVLIQQCSTLEDLPVHESAGVFNISWLFGLVF